MCDSYSYSLVRCKQKEKKLQSKKIVKEFKQITNSAEPKIIGTKNGVYQIEIEDKDLETHPNHKELDRLFISGFKPSINKFNDEVQKIRIQPLKGKVIKKAKVTDLMGFCPYFFSCKYIVSEKIAEVFKSAKIDKSEFRLFPIKLINNDSKFYILFVPMIINEEIFFDQSLIYPSRQAIKENEDYLKIKSFKDYKECIDKSIFTNFEKVVLPKKHQEKGIISIQGISDLFFSERLLEKVSNQNLKSFRIPKRQIELSFI
jgi:hypothetical protein